MHREEAARLSARALKDTEFGLVEEYWTTPRKNQRNSVGQLVIFGSLIAMVMLVAISLGGGSVGGGGGGRRSTGKLAPEIAKRSNGVFSDLLSDVIPRESEITRFEDFGRGMREWVGSTRLSSQEDWSVERGGIRPGSLRLWTRSLPLTDYRFLFEGSIQRSGMTWAYRAGDVQNFYSSRLRVLSDSRVEIVRSIFQNGKEVEQMALPLPLRLNLNRSFRVAMAVEGDQYVTFVDGQQVDQWSDARFHTGGVGFLSRNGDSAQIRWVSVTDTTHPLWRTPISGMIIAPPVPLQ